MLENQDADLQNLLGDAVSQKLYELPFQRTEWKL